MERFPDRFEAQPAVERFQTRKQANKGELVFAEKHPFDPLLNEETRMMSHRGGLATARTELY